jgi:hypothetical protein
MTRFGFMALLVILAGCAPPREPASAPPAGTSGAPLGKAEPGPPATAGNTPAVPAPSLAPSLIEVPPGALYVCVADVEGTKRQTTIELEPSVDALCRKHPEMGPCQYERNACRRAGGRVYAAGGKEITGETEAEYDRKVMRVRLKAN